MTHYIIFDLNVLLYNLNNSNYKTNFTKPTKKNRNW